MNSIPCEYEEKARILPKQIAISGKAFKNSKMEFFSKTKVLLAPALNYKNNTSEKKKIFKKYNIFSAYRYKKRYRYRTS